MRDYVTFGRIVALFVAVAAFVLALSAQMPWVIAGMFMGLAVAVIFG